GAVAAFFIVVSGGTRLITRGRGGPDNGSAASRGLSLAFAVALLMLAFRVYLGRFERLFDDHTVFAGVTYTDAHVTLTGSLVIAIALAFGALVALACAALRPQLRWLAAAVVPAAVCYAVVRVTAWYVSNFIVKPNELVRESPYITHNIEMTQRAFGLHRIAQQAFPAETTVEAADAANNQATLQNIRLWDWL